MDSTSEPLTNTHSLLRLLAMLFDKWENGTPCYENPADFEGYLGNAFHLTDREETEILTILDQYGIRTAITAAREAATENANRAES